MPGIFPFMRDFSESSCKIRLLSDTYGYTSTTLQPSLMTPQLHLYLPEVWAPAQHLIDVGLRPTLARRLSSTYMHFVARYRETCQSHFDRATHGRSRLTEYYREVFTVLFKRTIQASGSQIISIVRVHLSQAGALQAAVPGRMDIRVDDASKAEIIARLGLDATHLTCDRMVTSIVASRLEKVSEPARALSADTADYQQLLSELSPISSTEVTSRPLDLFSQPAPPTCFPASYPPPLEHSLSYSSQKALAMSFIPPATRGNVRPLTNYSPDMFSLTDLFDRMTLTTLKDDSTNPKCHRISGNSGFDTIKPVPSPNVENCSRESQLASIKSNASPPKLTTTARRRKIAALPTRRGKTSASPTPTVLDPAGTTSYSTPRVVEEPPPGYIHSSPQKPRLVSTTPSPYTAEVQCFATPKSSIPRQRKVQTLRKTLSQTQPIPHNQTSKPLATTGETSYDVSRSPPLVSDATSYFDSPPTSSDELDTPPSTPPSSHVSLASTSTESLAISSESDRIISYKEPLGDAKLPYPRQRYRCLDFTKGGLGWDEKPLTFTFSV